MAWESSACRLRDDPLWQGIDDPVFHAWWPSQLAVGEGVSVLATYGEALADAFSSDLNVGDTLSSGWPGRAGGRITGSISIPIACSTSRRSFAASMAEEQCFCRSSTLIPPAIPMGRWSCVTGAGSLMGTAAPRPRLRHPLWDSRPHHSSLLVARPSLTIVVDEMTQAVDGLVRLGFRNFLLFEQGPLMLQWSKGRERTSRLEPVKVLMDELTETHLRTRDGPMRRTHGPPFFQPGTDSRLSRNAAGQNQREAPSPCR